MSTVNSYNATELFYNLNDSVAELNGLEETITNTDINDDNSLRSLIKQAIVPYFHQFNKESQAKILLALRYCILQLTPAQLFAQYNAGMPLLYIPQGYDIRHFYELIGEELKEQPALGDEAIRQLQDQNDDTEALPQ
jgi:hypothetical protein